ncbi:MAG: SGNH/GDSL hydrolase family protein [Kiritimatiellae bacterium]|nr:SGNH/GDSL hydrolase family protein [Kiritimatiellia bacterium]
MIPREHIEWRDIWVTGADDDGTPRALFVGDSITRSYFTHVEEQLKGSFLCARMTTSACVADQAMGRELALLLDDYRFTVIHFNNGLHGWGYDETSYANGLSRMLDSIAGRSPWSTLIWANSTPVRRKGCLSTFAPETERVRERNRLACGIAATRKMPINDLFGCVADHPEYFAEDGVHFNAGGQSVLGTQVARMILKEGKRRA